MVNSSKHKQTFETMAKKIYNKYGEGMLQYSIKINVRLSAFCNALADYAYGQKSDSVFKSGKRAIQSILKKQLSFNGISGEYYGLDSLGENQKEHNGYYEQAKEYARKNFLYLFEGLEN